MSLIVDQINAYVNPDEAVDVQARAFEQVKRYVVDNSMQDLIELLEDKLVGGEDRERNRATTLLADLFHSTKLNLHASVIHLYAVFFCHRLSDYPSIIPSLHALTALVQLYGAEFEPKYCDALDIFQAIFRSIVVPTYPQTVRHKVLKLFRELLANESFVTSLQPNAADILNGLICCIEEEKDPRCLLEVFSLMSVAFSVFSHALTTEVVLTTDEADGTETQRTLQLAVRGFESLSCYFPITFNPPPNDPFGITPQALTSTLEDCLCTYYTLPAESSDNEASMEVTSSVANAFDGNAMVRQSVGFLLKQLTGDLYVGKVHALRALARIVRTNPLRHRVFALIPADFEGENAQRSTDLREESSQSAVDAELFAMVEDGDEGTDYSDLHIQSTYHNSTTGAGKATQTPQQRLLNELSQLQGTLYRLATENESNADGVGPAWPEGTMDLVAGALLLIDQIAAAIGTEFGADGTSVDWQTFGAPLLNKISLELSTDLSSAKAKAAIDIAYVIARMGGNACCAAVLQVLAPQLTAITATAQINLKKEVQRAAQDAVRRVDRVLSLGTGSSNKTATVGVSSEDGRLAVGIEMLAQLIACIGASPLELTSTNNNHHDHAHDHSNSSGGFGGQSGGGCGGGHGHSHDHSHTHSGSCGHNNTSAASSPSSSIAIGDTSTLGPHLDALFPTLAAFVQPSVVTLEGNEGSVAVNPFLAVKSAFTESAEPASSSTNNDDAVMTESQMTVFAVPAAAVLAMVASISAMRELIARCQLPTAEVTTYVEQVTEIAIHSVSVLFPTADPSVLTVQSSDQRAPALETLHRACVSFLVSLGSACGGAYKDILQGHSVQLLLDAVRTASSDRTVQASIDSKVFPLLSVLTGAVQDNSLLTTIVPALTMSVQDTLSTDNVSEGLSRLLLAVQALRDILPSTPTAATLSAADVSRNAGKAEQLLGLSGIALSEDSAVLTVLKLVHSHIDLLVNLNQDTELAALLDVLYSFVRGLSLSLTAVSAQTALAVALIDAFLPAQTTALSAAQVSLAMGLVTNSLACLDKSSGLFQEISASEAMLTRCVDSALHSVRTFNAPLVESKVFHSGAPADFGAAQLIAVIVNKIQASTQCVNVVSRVIATFRELHTTPATQLEKAKRVDSLLLWTVRAVSMRSSLNMAAEAAQEQMQLQRNFVSDLSGHSGDPTSVATWQEFLLQDLITLLHLPVSSTHLTGESVQALQLRLASQLHVLTVDHDVILSSTLRATATQSALFWKQKLWSRLFNPLSQTKPLANVNLVAICALTEGMPMNVLQDSLTQLVEVVVTAVSRAQNQDGASARSSDVDAAEVLAQQSLRTLEKLLGHDAQLFVSHLNIIVPALMETSQRAGAARLRATALEALLIITEHIPYSRLYPFKGLVSKGLQRTLDDKKKAVRVLAGRVRNKWIVMK